LWHFTGGDITREGETMIRAMGAGKTAAADMNGWLKKNGEWNQI